MTKKTNKLDPGLEQAIKEIEEARKLLSPYDIIPFAFDPGVRCYVHGDGNTFLYFDDTTWKFVKERLKEICFLKRRLHRLQSSIKHSKW